jgi:hypothetical protein
VALSSIVQTIQREYSASNSTFSKTVASFYESLEEKTSGINEIVQVKTNEMLFAVNAAINRQMEILGNSPQITQDSLDTLAELKLNHAKMNQKVDDVRDTVVQIAASFGGSMQLESVTTEAACDYIRQATDRDRRQVLDVRRQLDKLTKQFDDFKETFDVLLPFNRLGYPEWNQNVCYNRAKTPAFPNFPQEFSVYSYFVWLSKTLPYVQAVLREFHAYLLQLDAQVAQKSDRGEFERIASKTKRVVNALMDDVEDYRSKKDMFVLHQHFEELASDIYGIVNGASNAAATNTRCIACGKMVQRTTGTLKPRAVSQQMRPDDPDARTVDFLKLDGLQQEPVLSVKKVSTPRATKRPQLLVPK